VAGAYIMQVPERRTDAAILEMKGLGDAIYYGG
jgi:hypothetical protein